jgi:hypothetical protein
MIFKMGSAVSGLVFKAPTVDSLIMEVKNWDPSDWTQMPPFLVAVPAVELPLGYAWYKGFRLPFHELALVGFPVAYFLYEGFEGSTVGKITNAVGGWALLKRAFDILTHPSKTKALMEQYKVVCEQDYKAKHHKEPSRNNLGLCVWRKSMAHLFGSG